MAVVLKLDDLRDIRPATPAAIAIRRLLAERAARVRRMGEAESETVAELAARVSDAN